MYDIERSNLLSTNTMKMYLYDLAVLGTVKGNIENQIVNKKRIRNNLGRTEEFNSRPYRHIYHDREEYIIIYATTLVLVFIAMIVSAFMGAGWKDWVENVLLDNMGETTTMLVLCGFYLATPIIPIRLKMKKERQQEKLDDIAEQRARKQFEKEEDRRLQKESKQIVLLNNEIKELEQELCSIDNEIAHIFNMDILHKEYQDVKVCGVMFQLFDTGRVHNLTDAMNLYEDLKWKAEMKSMLQALLEKVDDLLSVQKNIEYYSRCITGNQIETNKILQDVSLNQRQIQSNQEAIEMNTEVIRFNTNTMRMLEEFRFIQSERCK